MRKGTSSFRILSLVLLGGFLVLIMGQYIVLAQEITERELPIFIEVPTVITAARKAQPITEAPAFVTVITAEDIRQSGATSLAEVLRMVPGVDVMHLEGSDAQVSMRGFAPYNGMSDKILVMIDGRSVYLDYYNTVIWNINEISMEDIQTIEVVQGPVSPLYGANAFSGAINIITKSPEEAIGTYFSATAGQRDTSLVSLIHGNVEGNIAYKISGNLAQCNRWAQRDDRSAKTGNVNGLIEYRFDEDKKVSLSAGSSYADKLEMAASGLFGEGTGGFYKLNYNQPNISFQFFRVLFNSELLYGGLQFNLKSITRDIEFQNTLDLGLNSSLIWGLNYRQIRGESELALRNGKVAVDRSAFYFQHDFKPWSNLVLYTGGRVDHDGITEHEYFSPRIAAVYTPVEDHIFRLSYGKAFRLPSLLESFASLQTTYPAPLDAFTLTLTGADDVLKPEVISSYELGYQGRLSPKARLIGNIHYSKLARIIDSLQTNYALVPTLTQTLEYRNTWHGNIFGGEIGLDYLLTNWLTGTVNYSYIDVTDKARGRDYDMSPEHKVNLGLRADWENGFTANLTTHFVSGIKGHFDPYVDPGLGVNDILLKTDDYVIVNFRLGYRFNNDAMEIALGVFNLFDEEHREFPGPSPAHNLAFGGSKIGRQITFNFNYKF